MPIFTEITPPFSYSEKISIYCMTCLVWLVILAIITSFFSAPISADSADFSKVTAFVLCSALPVGMLTNTNKLSGTQVST